MAWQKTGKKYETGAWRLLLIEKKEPWVSTKKT